MARLKGARCGKKIGLTVFAFVLSSTLLMYIIHSVFTQDTLNVKFRDNIDISKKLQSCEDIDEWQESEPPNILFLFADQLRFDWIDNYYHHDLLLHTPTIRELENNGTRFMNVIVGSPTCVPSRGTLASGMEYDKLGMMGNSYDWPSDKTTFYKYLQQNGYWTMITGKDDLTKKHGVNKNGDHRINELGFNDQRRCKGKLDVDKSYPSITDPYAKYLSTKFSDDTNKISDFELMHKCYQKCDGMQAFCKEPCTLNDELSYQDNWITMQSLNILDNKPNNKTPWFLQVNYAGPHDPFLITKRINDRFNLYKNRTFPDTKKYTEIEALHDHKRLNNDKAREQYSLEIENLDEQIKIMINKLHEMNEYESTIICLSSDHGDMLGDADDFGKFKPWIQSTNVPLICSGPNIKRKQRINTYVSLIDLAATFLEYSFPSNSSNSSIVQIPNEMDSISLKPFLNGTWTDQDNEYKDYVISGLNPWRLAIKQINSTTTWKFICCAGSCPDRRFRKYYKNGRAELLYNLKLDLYEQHNVAHLYPQAVQEMKQLLPKSRKFNCN